ncbi:hypothetical protein ACJX0J_041778, partial [Zea mays]
MPPKSKKIVKGLFKGLGLFQGSSSSNSRRRELLSVVHEDEDEQHTMEQHNEEEQHNEKVPHNEEVQHATWDQAAQQHQPWDHQREQQQRMGPSSRSSCSNRPNEQELEIMRMREEMRQQREFMDACNAHNQAMYQLMQQQGMTPNIPPPPQWSQFASTPASGLGTQQFNNPPTHIPAPGDR